MEEELVDIQEMAEVAHQTLEILVHLVVLVVAVVLTVEPVVVLDKELLDKEMLVELEYLPHPFMGPVEVGVLEPLD